MTLGIFAVTMEPPDIRDSSRELVFSKMESLIREMQHPETGVPVRNQKLFLTSIPCAFLGYDMVEWLMDRLDIEEQEAVHLSNLLCQHGYFFPVGDTKSLTIRDDSTLYRFQSPYFWPSNHQPDNTDYAIYLVKRALKNKQRHNLEEHEQEALARLKKLLCHKWDFICLQAEEQANVARDQKKGDKIVLDSQEKAYWRVHRPPPGTVSCLERTPLNSRRVKKKSKDDLKREVDRLRKSLGKPRVKVSQVLDSLMNYAQDYMEFDPQISAVQPSNPWLSEDTVWWTLNGNMVQTPTEQRVRKWTLSLEELLADPRGTREFELYLRKEYSHENILFWRAVQLLKKGSQADIDRKVKGIYEEFLAPGAPCEVNLDGKTVETTTECMSRPSRFTFDSAQQHVFSLMEKDTYPRFLRSDHYRGLLLAALQPSQKKRFFNFRTASKKKLSSRSKRQDNHLSGSSVDLSRSLELEEPSMSSRHSLSTSDLHDLGMAVDIGTHSRLPPPGGSPSQIRPCTLQVPQLSRGGSDDGALSEDLSLPVPTLAARACVSQN